MTDGGGGGGDGRGGGGGGSRGWHGFSHSAHIVHGTKSFSTEVAWVILLIAKTVDARKKMNKEDSKGNELAIIFSWQVFDVARWS